MPLNQVILDQANRRQPDYVIGQVQEKGRNNPGLLESLVPKRFTEFLSLKFV